MLFRSSIRQRSGGPLSLIRGFSDELIINPVILLEKPKVYHNRFQLSTELDWEDKFDKTLYFTPAIACGVAWTAITTNGSKFARLSREIGHHSTSDGPSLTLLSQVTLENEIRCLKLSNN